MSRRVQLFKPTWKDRRFEKTFKKLNAVERTRILTALAELSSALSRGVHPTLHPALQKYRPSGYQGVALLKRGGQLLEYRLPSVSRVIAKYPAREEVDDILLLAITIDHHHEHMKELIKQYRQEIDDWQERENGDS